MNGAAFYKCACAIVGRDNAEIYARKFGDLDGIFFDNLKNYEGLAFYIYSTSMGWHAHINGSLWSGAPDGDVVAFRDVLNSALSKLQSLKGAASTVYRGYFAEDLERFVAGYRVDELIIFPGFTSASFHEAGAFGGNVLFIIRALNAYPIWHLAADYYEHEVLIPAGARFNVVEIQLRSGRAVIVLQER